MVVNINGNEFKIKDSLKNWIIYEELNGNTEINSITDMVKFFYSCVLASDWGREDFINFVDFIEWLDYEENEPLERFGEWFSQICEKRNTLTNSKKKKVKS